MVAMDQLVGEIEDAAMQTSPDAVVAVVSDHVFSRTDYRVNLMVPFRDAGLIQVSTGSHGPAITSWDAMLWPDGGSIAVVLRDPSNEAIKQKVVDLLEKLQADPQYGINRILAQPELTKLGGFPTASFLVELKLDYQSGYSLTGPLLEKVPSTGMHGYLPDNPDLRSSFFIEGEGIARGRDLGVIDMRQITPTLARLLEISMPTAKQKPVDVRK